jgi:hypothetical protein
MATLKMYLTSLEPNLAQTIYSQSIGGYYSTSLVYPETTLDQNVGLYDTSFVLHTPATGVWTDWVGTEFININNEVIQVSPITNGSITVVERGHGGSINMHRDGDVVRAVSAKHLMNDVLSDERKQYRCIAIKNDSPDDDPSDAGIAYDFSVYVGEHSGNDDSSIKVAIERPKNQYMSGTSTSRGTGYLVDTSLIGAYADDFFKDAYLRVTTTLGGKISSFDSSSGRFDFYTSFSSSTVNTDYEILPAPAQRVKTGIESPTNNDYISSFIPTNANNRLNFNSTGLAVSTLSPHDLFYIWIERTIGRAAASYENNDIIINIRYSNVSV